MRARRLELAARSRKGGRNEGRGGTRASAHPSRASFPERLSSRLPRPLQRPFPPAEACDWLEASDVRVSMTCRGGGRGRRGRRGRYLRQLQLPFGRGAAPLPRRVEAGARGLWRTPFTGTPPGSPPARAPRGPAAGRARERRASAPDEDRLLRAPGGGRCSASSAPAHARSFWARDCGPGSPLRTPTGGAPTAAGPACGAARETLATLLRLCVFYLHQAGGSSRSLVASQPDTFTSSGREEKKTG